MYICVVCVWVWCVCDVWRRGLAKQVDGKDNKLASSQKQDSNVASAFAKFQTQSKTGTDSKVRAVCLYICVCMYVCVCVYVCGCVYVCVFLACFDMSVCVWVCVVARVCSRRLVFVVLHMYRFPSLKPSTKTVSGVYNLWDPCDPCVRVCVCFVCTVWSLLCIIYRGSM